MTRLRLDSEKLSTYTTYLQKTCHDVIVAMGVWNDLKTGESLKGKRNVAEMLALIQTEIAEALQGHRRNLKDEKISHRPALEVELVDALIRIFDTAEALGLDLGGALAEKLAYNLVREDYKKENRLAEDGKKY